MDVNPVQKRKTQSATVIPHVDYIFKYILDFCFQVLNLRRHTGHSQHDLLHAGLQLLYTGFKRP